jgi:signal transduction histidine kinase
MINLDISPATQSPLIMPVAITCPSCAKVIHGEDAQCPGCGLKLSMAVLIAEHTLASSSSVPSGTPMTPEILVPRLGDYLIEKGVLSPQELQRALIFQQEQAASGRIILLGQALLELDLVQHETLDQVITEQILQLQLALRESNRQLESRVEERTAELRTALEKLTELNQLKSSFISSISHELRTPLTHLKGYLDLLGEGSLGDLNPAQEEAVSVLLKAESRLEQLIDNLISFSLAARGELSLNLGPMNLNEIVEQALGQTQKLAHSRNVRVAVKVGPDLPSVRADAEKITWVLQQLLDNAVKFTPAGGEVALKTIQESGMVRIWVSDTGIGISEEKLDEIFQPFHQLDGSDNRRYGGAGLGLALVQKIVEAHGSLIKVSSTPGQGSCFEFHLPAFIENKPYV